MLLLFAMAFDGQGDEAVDEFFIRDAAGLPELGVHADAGEAGHGIDFIEVDAAGLRFPVFLCFRGWGHEEVDAGESGAVAGAEGGEGHLADLFGLGVRELRERRTEDLAQAECRHVSGNAESERRAR